MDCPDFVWLHMDFSCISFCFQLKSAIDKSLCSTKDPLVFTKAVFKGICCVICTNLIFIYFLIIYIILFSCLLFSSILPWFIDQGQFSYLQWSCRVTSLCKVLIFSKVQNLAVTKIVADHLRHFLLLVSVLLSKLLRSFKATCVCRPRVVVFLSCWWSLPLGVFALFFLLFFGGTKL